MALFTMPQNELQDLLEKLTLERQHATHAYVAEDWFVPEMCWRSWSLDEGVILQVAKRKRTLISKCREEEEDALPHVVQLGHNDYIEKAPKTLPNSLNVAQTFAC